MEGRKHKLKRVIISLITSVLVLGPAGSTLAAAPNIMHMPINMAFGLSNASSSLEIMTRVSDDTVTPTSTPDKLTVTVHYKTVGVTDWATTTCNAIDTDTPLHRCSLDGNSGGIAQGNDLRVFQYYIKADDGNATSCAAYTATNCDTAESDPYQTTIYNSPNWWSNAISGRYDDAAWAGTKDGRCFGLQQAVSIGDTSVYVASTTENMAALGNAPNTWIELSGTTFEKFEILSTSTDVNGLKLTLSGATAASHTTNDCVDKFISGVNVFIPGLGKLATSSDVNTTSTFGTFLIDDVPDGCWEVAAFKKGYKFTSKSGVCLNDTSTSTVSFFLPYGHQWGEGGDTEGAFVMWSMPGDGMMDAPTKIGLTEMPIVVYFSENLATTTASSTSNVLLKKVAPDGTQTQVSVELIYEEAGLDAYSTGCTEAKIIIYSETELASFDQYIVVITKDVTDAQGNPVEGNNPDGGHVIFFNTGGSFWAGGEEGVVSGDNFGKMVDGVSFMPPFIMNVMPGMGRGNVARNTKIAIQFSETMTSDATVLSNNIQVWQLNASYQEVSQVSVTVALDNSKEMVIVTPPAAGLAANTKYRVKVKGGMQSSSGMAMGPPDTGAAMVMFETEFETGASFDDTAPTKTGTSLDRYKDPAGNYTGVPTAGVIKIKFNESIGPDTLNTNNLYVRKKGSSTNISATTEYDMMADKVLWLPQSAFNASTTYVLTLSANIKDFTTTTNAFAGDTVEFTTTFADTEGPRLEFADADDFSIAVGYSEPMNAAKVTNTQKWPSGSTKWETSVLNPANYVVTHRGDTAENYVDPSNAAANLSAASGITLQYNALDNEVIIKGLQLLGTGFSVTAANVTDISGNAIQAGGYGLDKGGGPIMSGEETFGMGMGGGMFGPPPEVGGAFHDNITDAGMGGKDPRMMGMMPVGVWPMSMVAFQKTTYMIDIPITAAVPAGGKIKIGPFEAADDVAGAKNADPDAKFAHYDINGPGPGKVVIDTTTAETSGGANNDGVTISGKTIIVTLGSVATGANDFLHLEIDDIKNPDVGTYKINIETQTAAGVPLESWKDGGSNPPMPFFIMPAGKYIIVGHVSSTDTLLNEVNVFGGSPSTGPFGTSTDTGAFGSSTDGEFKVAGLNAGQAMIMTEPVISVGGSEYIAPMPEPIFLDDYTTADSAGAAMDGQTGCTSNTACYYYKEINLTKVSTADTPGLVVYIYGNFDTVANGGMGNADVDIFAGGRQGFRVKEVNLAADYSATPYSAILYLPTTGDFHVGIGPAMPKGMMGMGMPEMPDKWMPPKPADITVEGSAGSWTWTEHSSANAATSTVDGLITFTVPQANLTVSGTVYDPDGNVIKGKGEVFAYSPTEMFGTGTHVKGDGTYTLNLVAGFYRVGVFMPGAPPSDEIGVKVESDGTVYVDGVETAKTAVNLYLFKDVGGTNYVISGKVYSDTERQYVATDASVYAFRSDGPGHAETMSDPQKGTYTLYVGPGTWKVGAYLPTHGDLPEETVTLPLPDGSTFKSGLNFSPSAAVDYVTIRERVWQDADNDGTYDNGEGIANAIVTVNSSSTDYGNNAVTDSKGLYEVKVPGDSDGVPYDVEVWSPEVGELPPVKNLQVTTSDILYSDFAGYADVPTEHATTVEITFYDAAGNATSVDKVLVQLDQTGTEGVSNDVYKENVATTTLKVSTSTEPYILDIDIRGVPKDLLVFKAADANTDFGSTTVASLQFTTTTVDGYEKIKVTLPEISYISGTVKDQDGAAVGNAIIQVEQPGKDIEFNVKTDSSGNYSFKVASSTSAYLIQADASGYIDSAITVNTGEPGITFNPEIQKATSTISGSITFTDLDGDQSCYAWAEKLGGGHAATRGSCNANTGTYSVPVSDGDWEVTVVVEGKTEATQSTIAQVSEGQDATGVDLAISATGRTDIIGRQDAVTMGGNVGGRVVNDDSGFELNVPRAAISATDSSSYNVKEKEVSNIPSFSPTSNLVGNKADEVTAFKPSSSGTGVVSKLNEAAFIDKTFTKAQLASEGIDTLAEVEESKMGYYDPSVKNWTNLPTTLTYLDSDEQPVIPESDLGNVEKVVFNGATKHFSTFGVLNTKFDGLAPKEPSNVTATGLAGGIQVSWSAVTENIDDTTANDILYYNVYRSSASNEVGSWTKIGRVSSGTTSYLDTLAGGETYYYRVTADTGLQSNMSSASGASSLGTTVPGTAPAAPAPAEEVVEEVVEEEVVEEVVEEAAEEIVMAPAEEVTPAEEVVAEEVEIPTVTFEKPIAQMTATEVAAKITEIIEVIAQLKNMVLELQAKETALAGIPSDYTFEVTVKYGQTSDDVTYLQQFLKAQGTAIYPEGLVTGWFGPLTKAAVIRFQEKYAADILAPWGLTKGTGLVGETTRAKINQLLGR